MTILLRLLPIFCALIMLAPAPARAEVAVTILYDAFGAHPEMTRDWGFSALVEYRGQRILFDTGNDPDTLAHNLGAAGVDLATVDFAIVSHRHGDHIGGLSHVLSERPDLTVYTPRENFSVFGMAFSGDFFRQDPTLPARLRYFGGNPPAEVAFGSAWPDGDFRWIGETVEIAPGLHLIANHGDWGVDLDVKELSLAIETENGLILIVGCSHPTIETIVRTATEATGRPVDTIVGGLHLLPADHAEFRRVAEALRDEWRVQRIAPGHCTGEHALAIIREVFGDAFIEAGLGSTIVR
ncbi:MAG: MBL fold metallo-hydrolase [Parasphingopyxis sp.]|uniref:MBL fold metallo-hydrolase n=1 Tax=Parasphingopyxis sp. TaxID=1920299 RepID=UPI003F9F049D